MTTPTSQALEAAKTALKQIASQHCGWIDLKGPPWRCPPPELVVTHAREIARQALADLSHVPDGEDGGLLPPVALHGAFQSRVHAWIIACFGAEIGSDVIERNHRFLEESLELVQSNGCTASEAHQLVDYVYGRPVGEPKQEVGGVMNTLAALCTAADIDMADAGEVELTRVWTKVEQIRAKQAAKPKHSPLPGPSTSHQASTSGSELKAPSPTPQEERHALITDADRAWAEDMAANLPPTPQDGWRQDRGAIARTVWIAEGGRPELWDNSAGVRWASVMDRPENKPRCYKIADTILAYAEGLQPIDTGYLHLGKAGGAIARLIPEAARAEVPQPLCAEEEDLEWLRSRKTPLERVAPQARTITTKHNACIDRILTALGAPT